ncbi:MAG: hypothetical protein ACLSWZ_01335 [Parabacteroides distasonis]
MKHIIVIGLTLFLTVFVMAQERNYISTCGKTKTSVKWSEEHKDGKIYLNTVQGNEKHEYILDNGYKTESWKIINPVSNTSLTVNLKNGKSLEYECFRPDNIKLYTMSAVKKGIEKFDGRNTIKIEICLTGFMSVFWSCDYYFDTTTLMFVGYKGVNGGPGTPETKISISR